MRQKLKKLLTPENLSLGLILIFAFVLRSFRITEILDFHYDQGRDALVLWDLIHEPHKFFLIGPTTGLPGVFRGPFYYYLIAPFYWIGNGNPILPVLFLIFLSTAALYFTYKVAKEIGGSLAGLITLILAVFSFEVIYSSRWLSNPTPMLLLSVLLIWSLLKIHDGVKNYWLLVSLILGLSFFSFGSSGELFYFPAVFIFALWQFLRKDKSKKTLPGLKLVLICIGIFILTFAPLWIFNYRHGQILINNVDAVASGGPTFLLPSWRFVLSRGSQILAYFSALIFHNPYEKELVLINLFYLIPVFYFGKLFKNEKFRIILLFLVSVFVGLLFYQGNHGNLYSYYLTGYFLIFLVFIGISLTKLSEGGLAAKMLLIFLMFTFISQNWNWTRSYLSVTGEEPNKIVLNTQKKAIDWIYNNRSGREFNIDVYVPPVISHSYDYLFKWLGTTRYNQLPSDQRMPLLYTLYESDPDHPERLEAWLARQEGIGEVIKEATIGGVTVQERNRIK